VIEVLLIIPVALPAALGYIMLVLTSSVTDRSGHRSNAVQIYKRPCVEQQKAVSSALDVYQTTLVQVLVRACVKSEDGKVKTHVANDVPVYASSDNCLRIVLPSGITDVIVL